jgi:sorting nexin-8
MNLISCIWLTLTSIMRGRVGPLIDHWQRICILAERIIKRREAAAVRVPPALRRVFVPTHFNLNLTAPLSPSSHTSSLPDSSQSMIGSLSQSFLGVNHLPYNDGQGDLARLTNTLRAVIEISETCWRGDDCELSNGVRSGLAHVAAHTQRQSEIAEMRVMFILSLPLSYSHPSDSLGIF